MKTAGATVLLALGLSVGVAFGHAHLVSSSPGDGATVHAVEDLALEFSMPIQLNYSQFGLYRITDGGSEPGPAARAALRDGAAGAGLEAVSIEVANSSGGGTARTIAFQVDGSLEAGEYIFAWRVLAIDTHTSDGHLVFTYEAAN